MTKEKMVDLYMEYAREFKKHGYKCFLYNNIDDVTGASMYIVTPGNSLLYLYYDRGCGFNITYEYIPSKKFGSGIRCNNGSLDIITVETLIEAEKFGRSYGEWMTINVANRYNTGSHDEKTFVQPKHYENAYSALKNMWLRDKLTEI